MAAVANRIAGFVRSPALRAAMMLTAGGVGFAVATLLLARVMDAQSFGEFSLMLALVQLSVGLGPLGTELTINRNRLGPSRHWASWIFSSSCAAALVMAMIGSSFYGLPQAITWCVGVAAMTASLNRVGCAFLQAHERFTLSLVFGQMHNYVLLFAVLLLLAIDSRDALPAAVLMACSYSFASFGSWYSARALKGSEIVVSTSRVLKESLAGFGIALAGQVLWQLERLVIPRVLSFEDLAIFAVVAAVAGSPYRMLHNGVGHTLLPRLRASQSVKEASHLLSREAAVISSFAALATVAVFVFSPLVLDAFLQGRYPVSTSLLVAAVLTGFVKVANGFANAVVMAFGTTDELAKINVINWTSLIASVGAAAYGARFGIVGVVYGSGLGWLLMALCTWLLAAACLRQRFAILGSIEGARDARSHRGPSSSRSEQ